MLLPLFLLPIFTASSSLAQAQVTTVPPTATFPTPATPTTTTAAVPAASTPVSTFVPVSFPNWAYLGCFRDVATASGSTTIHALEYSQISSALTHESCTAICQARGAPYAGMEYGRECWCGTPRSPEAVVQVPESDCSMYCSGSQQQTCGDVYKMSLFRNVALFSSSSSSSSSAPTSTPSRSSSPNTMITLRSSSSSAVNAATSQTSSSHSSTASSGSVAADASSSSSTSNTGAIAGGVIAAAAVLALGAFLGLCMRKRRSRRRAAAFAASRGRDSIYGGVGVATGGKTEGGAADGVGGGAWTEGGEDLGPNDSSEKIGMAPLATLARTPQQSQPQIPDYPYQYQQPYHQPQTEPDQQPQQPDLSSSLSSQGHLAGLDQPLAPDTNPFDTPASTSALLYSAYDVPPLPSAALDRSLSQQSATGTTPSSYQPPGAKPMARQGSLKRKPVPQLSPEDFEETLDGGGDGWGDTEGGTGGRGGRSDGVSRETSFSLAVDPPSEAMRR